MGSEQTMAVVFAGDVTHCQNPIAHKKTPEQSGVCFQSCQFPASQARPVSGTLRLSKLLMTRFASLREPDDFIAFRTSIGTSRLMQFCAGT